MQSHRLSWLILVALILFSGRFFLSTQLFDTHDLEYHAARTANYYLALQQGQIPPRWSPNLNYSFGLPTFMFAYPLPYFAATAFFLLVGSIQLSVNLALFSFWCIGSFGMFYYAKVRTEHNFYALLVALSYFAAPYSLLVFFERGAFGEASFFALLPLVLLAIHWQNNIRSPWYLLGSYGILLAFLLTHPQSLVAAVPIVVGWTLLGYKKIILLKYWRQKVFLLVSVCLSVQFFWIPLLLEAKQTYISEAISSTRLLHSFPVFSRLFWPTVPAVQVIAGPMLITDFTTTLGVSLLLLLAGGIFVVTSKKRTITQFFWLAIILLSIFFMHPAASFFWAHVGSFKVIQFPWRLLSVSVFASSLLFIECLPVLSKHRTIRLAFLSLFFCVSLANLVVWGKPKGYISRSDYDWFEYFGTASSFDEFIPRGFDHEENLRVTDKLALSTAGETIIDFWSGSRMLYRVTTDESTLVLQKTAYFPGWKAYLNGNEHPIIHDSPEYPGRITLALPPGSHTVEVKFTNQTPIRQVADTTSVVGLGLLFIQVGSAVVWRRASGTPAPHRSR